MDATTLAERGAGEDLVRMRALQRADREPPQALDAAALRNATERERRWEDIRRAHLQLIRPSWLGTGLCGCCKNGGSIARRLLRPPSFCERDSRRDLAEHPGAARPVGGVDEGDQPQVVREWVRRQPVGRVLDVKGEPHGEPISLPKHVDVNWRGKKNPRGLKMYKVGTGVLKEELYGYLNL